MFKVGDKVLLFHQHEYTVVSMEEYATHRRPDPEARLFLKNKNGDYFWDESETHYTLKRKVLFEESM